MSDQGCAGASQEAFTRARHNKNSREFFTDLAVNGFGIIAVNLTALLFFYVIGKGYGPDALGGLNICLSLFLICGQVAPCGIQAAAFYHLPFSLLDPENTRKIAATALISACMPALLVSAAVWFGRPVMERIFDSQSVRDMLFFVAPALFFFTCNKILLNTISGMQHMRMYALLFAGRFPLMLLASLALLLSGAPKERLGAILLVSEVLTFCVGLWYVRRATRFSPRDFSLRWSKKLFSFGVYALPAGAMQALNTRVDILVLGIFYSDQYVGLYSFAAIIIEVLLQFAYAVRRNVDPMISRLSALKDPARLRRLLKTGVIIGLAFWVLIAVLSLSLFSPVLTFIGMYEQYHASFVFFAILLAGAVVWGSVVPVSGTLLQLGLPKQQSLLILCSMGTNLVLNFLLVPWLGGEGAAAATSVSFIVATALLFWLLKKHSKNF